MKSTPSTDLEVAPRARGDSSDTAPYAIEREIEDLAVLVDNLGEPETEGSTGAGGGRAGRHPISADRRRPTVVPVSRVAPAKGGSR